MVTQNFKYCHWCKIKVEEINSRTGQPYSHCAKHRAEKTNIRKKWDSNNRKSIAAKARRYNKNLRSKFFNMYGHKCACSGCSEANIKFMTIDHIQGGGIEHRKESGSNNKMIREAIAKYRPDLYQSLCWNCNCGHSANGGICPHLEE